MPEKKTGKQLTEHFNIDEFACNDGTPVPEEYWLQVRYLCRTFLEPMREKFGRCVVHSGFRTPEWNRRVGGASSSFHIYTMRRAREGVAADVEFERGSVADWHREAKRLRDEKRDGRGGIGFYPQGGFVHIDTRDYPADWNGS